MLWKIFELCLGSIAEGRPSAHLFRCRAITRYSFLGVLKAGGGSWEAGKKRSAGSPYCWDFWTPGTNNLESRESWAQAGSQ